MKFKNQSTHRSAVRHETSLGWFDAETLPSSHRSKSVLILLACSIALFSGCQNENAKWRFARAELDAEAGRVDSAVAGMENALHTIGPNPLLQLTLAEQLAKQGDERALDICDQVLDQTADWRTREFRVAVWRHKVELCHELGKFDEGLAIFKQILADHIERTPEELNGLAYCRALAGRDLMLAVAEIDQAMAQTENLDWQTLSHTPLPVRAEIAIALLSRQVNLQSAALNLLNRRALRLENELAVIGGAIQRDLLDGPTPPPGLETQLRNENRKAKQIEDLIRELLATVLSVRALLHQDLDQNSDCNSDRLRVRELEHDAAQIVSDLPPAISLELDVRFGAMFLDTRGFILSQLPWSTAATISLKQLGVGRSERISSYEEALTDLDAAVLGGELIQALLNASQFHASRGTVAEQRQFEADMQRMFATMLYHRMLLHQRQQAITLADQDRKKIQALGFEPSPKLY